MAPFVTFAGVSDVKVTMLSDLSRNGRHAVEFSQLVRSSVAAEWRPLVRFSSIRDRQWTQVFSQPDGNRIRLLVVNRSSADAFVAELRIDPDKLGAFIASQQASGIR